MLAAGCQRLLEFEADIALAALDLGELINEPPRAAVEVVHDGLTLSVEAEPGLSLLVCADPVIRDEPAEMRGHLALRNNCARIVYERIQTLQPLRPIAVSSSPLSRWK